MGGANERVSQAYGDPLGDCFFLDHTKSHVTRDLRRGPLAVTEIRSAVPTPEPSQSIAYDEAYLVGVMIGDVPNHELWQDGRAVPTSPFRAGETALFDLRRDPINFTRTGHHSLHFYLPRTALTNIAEQTGIRFSGELDYRFAQGYDDPVMRSLATAVLPALETGGALCGLFLDHILQGVAAHVLAQYGAADSARMARIGGLSALQLRRAQEMMTADLSAETSLSALAASCSLSVPHFSRAFRSSTGSAPHQWLLERRIEAAKALLSRSDASLAEVALDCGFADQSHFTRAFSSRTGISPGRWRRAHRPDQAG